MALSAELTARKWDVRLVYPKSVDTPVTRRWAAEAQVLRELSDDVPIDTGGRSLRQVVRFGRLVRRYRPDAVSIHYGGSDVSLKDMLVLVLSGAKARVVHLHAPSANAATRRKRLMTRLAAQLATAIVPCSEAVAEPVREAGVSEGKIFVIPGGVLPPKKQYSKPEARAALALPLEATVVSAVVRLTPEKGISELIDATANAILECPSLFLAIKGDDAPLLESYKALGESRLGARFRIFPADTDNSLVYSASDISVLPSYVEGYPLVLMEAAFYGLPVVATRVGGVPDLVQDGVTGLLVEPRDAIGLGRAIAHLACAPGVRAQMAGAAKIRAESVFSAGTMTERVERLMIRGGRP